MPRKTQTRLHRVTIKGKRFYATVQDEMGQLVPYRLEEVNKALCAQRNVNKNQT
jgi:hypothetical protein